MSTSSREYRLPVQKLSRHADKAIKQRLRAAAKQQRAPLFWLSPLALTAVALIIAIPLSTVGVRQYAYASPSVVPGSILYGLKRNLEKKELSALATATKRSQYYLTLSRRRLDEADWLLTKKPQLAQLIPTAHATGTSSNAVGLNVHKSTVGGLVVESSQFVSLSITEAAQIADQAKRNGVLADAQRALKQNTYTLDQLEQKIPTEKTALTDVTNNVQNVHANNHALVEKLLNDKEEDDSLPLWIEILDDDDEGFLDHFDDIHDWEELWEDDDDEHETYEPWHDEHEDEWEDHDYEEWWDEWEDDSDHEAWLEEIEHYDGDIDELIEDLEDELPEEEFEEFIEHELPELEADWLERDDELLEDIWDEELPGEFDELDEDDVFDEWEEDLDFHEDEREDEWEEGDDEWENDWEEDVDEWEEEPWLDEEDWEEDPDEWEE